MGDWATVPGPPVAPDSGTTSARRGVVWVYVVVAHPGEVLPVCGKVLRGAVT